MKSTTKRDQKTLPVPPGRTNPAWIYELNLVPTLFGPWARDLVAFVKPKQGDHVLDAGCGTGAVARLVPPLVGPNGRTVGLDFDAEMVAVAAELFTDVEWREGDLQSMPFDPSSFDLVICQQSFQFLPGREAGLREIHRVLRPAGRLALGVWTEIEKSPGQAILFKALGKLLGKDMGTPLPWSLADESELVGLLERAGLVVTQSRVKVRHSSFSSAKRFVESLMAGSSKLTRQALAQVPDPAKAAFIEDVANRLREYQTDEGIAIPMESRMLLTEKG